MLLSTSKTRSATLALALLTAFATQQGPAKADTLPVAPDAPIVASAPSVVGVDIVEGEGGALQAIDVPLGGQSYPAPGGGGTKMCSFRLSQNTSGTYVAGPGFADYGVLEGSQSTYSAPAQCNFAIHNMLSASALYSKGYVLSSDTRLCSSGACTEAVSAASYVCNTGPNCAGYYFERGHASFYEPTVRFVSKNSTCVVSNSGHTLVCDIATNGVTVSQTIPPGVRAGG